MPKVTGYPRDPVASDADLVEKASKLLEQGKTHRQTVREEIWHLVDKQYKGAHWSAEALEDPTATLTVVNMSFGTIQTIKPYITDQEPHFYLEPFSSDATRLNAALQEVFLNRIWRHPPVGAQEALRGAAFEYLKYGDGFLKGTYELVPRHTGIEEESNVAELHVDRVSPWDIWIDPYSDGLTSARWVAHRVWMTEDEATLDNRFTIPKDWEFTDDRSTDDEHTAVGRNNVGLVEGQRWVQLIEFYDITMGTMVCYPVANQTRPVGGVVPWQIIEDMSLPIVQLPNYDLGDSPWHIGDLEQISGLQDELNFTRSELMTHRRRNVAKTFVRKGTLDANAQDALQSPIVNEFVEIDTQEPLQNVVQAYQQQPISSDNYGSTREIKDDIREITGITEYQRGVAPDITRTATEASIMDASSNVKLGSKLTAIEEASRRLGAILLGIAREVFPETDPDEWAMFIGGDEAQRLARAAQGSQVNKAIENGDMQGAAEISSQQLPNEVITKPTAQMFVGDYEVLVEVGSTEYRDPKLKEETYRSMFFELMKVAPTLQQMGVPIDMGRVLRIWLESTDIIDIDSILSPMGGAPQMGAPPGMGAPGGDLMSMLMGGGAPPAPPMAPPGQPAPEDMQMIQNTGMLETGEIAPATPNTPSNAVPY